MKERSGGRERERERDATINAHDFQLTRFGNLMLVENFALLHITNSLDSRFTVKLISISFNSRTKHIYTQVKTDSNNTTADALLVNIYIFICLIRTVSFTSKSRTLTYSGLASVHPGKILVSHIFSVHSFFILSQNLPPTRCSGKRSSNCYYWNPLNNSKHLFIPYLCLIFTL